MDALFASVFTGTATAITPGSFLLAVAVSLAVGLFLAGVYMFRASYTASFVVTLALLPAIVSVVIMMVNGNIGAGVAVAGAFSLVRFRSVAGSAKEIGTIFLAMGAGLVAGMGYLAYAVLFALVVGAAMTAFQLAGLGRTRRGPTERTLRITIPEDLNYLGVFDEVFERYASAWQATSVKTTNMGSLYKLSYDVTLRDPTQEKAFIDELRCRNGNLEISLTQRETMTNEL